MNRMQKAHGISQKHLREFQLNTIFLGTFCQIILKDVFHRCFIFDIIFFEVRLTKHLANHRNRTLHFLKQTLDRFINAVHQIEISHIDVRRLVTYGWCCRYDLFARKIDKYKKLIELIC